jgi:hypothetical protein
LDLRADDLPPAAVGNLAPLRFASFPTVVSIKCADSPFFNIQG